MTSEVLGMSSWRSSFSTPGPHLIHSWSTAGLDLVYTWSKPGPHVKVLRRLCDQCDTMEIKLIVVM